MLKSLDHRVHMGITALLVVGSYFACGFIDNFYVFCLFFGFFFSAGMGFGYFICMYITW